jgi:crotonobetainyl-CoA:carnitine CoA-transferase CaiB-like acyl-CoA transferase
LRAGKLKGARWRKTGVSMSGPLAGLKVLDLSRVLAGPWAGQLLADLGAEVVKVERPGVGDDTRSWGPPYAKDAAGNETEIATYYLAANRGKHSIAVDISTKAGQGIVQRMITSCDILIENFKKGDLDRYGLGYDDAHALNPRLIYCSITGFGQTGPNAHRAGYDFIIQGMAGLMSLTGTAESGPMKSGVAVSDITTGLYATIGILAALNHVRATGVGQHLDLALFDVQLGWLANQNMAYLAGGKVPGLLGNAHPSIVPYQDFETLDGRIIVAVGNDAQFRKMCAALTIPELAINSKFSTNKSRVTHREELTPLLQSHFKLNYSAYWLEVLEAVGVPCGPIQSIAQAWESDQAEARQLKITLPHANLGTLTTVAVPIGFSETPLQPKKAPPTLGANTRDVMLKFGYDETQIVEFMEQNVISV